MNVISFSKGVPSTGVGRADLLSVLLCFGQEALPKMAKICGFELESSKPKKFPSVSRLKTKIGSEPIVQTHSAGVPVEPSVFTPWRIVSFEAKEQLESGEVPDWFHYGRKLPDEELVPRPNESVPAQKPLLPWSKLWPFLRGACGTWRKSGKVQVGKLVDGMTTGRWPRKIPRKPRLTWAPICHVILDFRDHLRPFRFDFLDTLEKICKMRGRQGFNIWITDQGHWQHVRPLGENEYRSFPFPASGTPVVVFGDLSQYQPDSKLKGAWIDFGNKLRTSGCRPLALTPAPRGRWDRDICKVWYQACWDEGARLPYLGVGGVSRLGPQAALPQKAILARDRLAALLSPAIRIEPSLLRAGRKLLPHRLADVGCEYDLWNHKEVRANDLAAVMKAACRQYYQNHFAAQGKTLCKEILKLIRQHHGWLSKAVWLEELATGYRLLGESFSEAERFFRQLSFRVEDRNDGIGSYVNRLASRLNIRDWEESEGYAIAFIRRNQSGLKDGTVALPPGLDLTRYPWALGLKRESISRILFWQGNQLVVQRNSSKRNHWQMGTALGLLTAPNSLLTIKCDGDLESAETDLNEKQAWTLNQRKGATLKTSHGTWGLEPMPLSERPIWAATMGCDARGLFADIEEGDGKRRVRWLPPGPYGVLARDGQRMGTFSRLQGCWITEAEFNLFEGQIFEQPDWADKMGVDSWGIFADVAIKSVVQRFRLIFPGSFLMGSPESEVGRFDDELQHHVTLTRGFWLADTACTQALWQAVMGENPSDFKGEDLPVEHVGWKDGMKFMQALTQIKPTLECRFPTEAEWEFACRAGTLTPFSFGQGITTDQVNYHGKYSLEGSPEGDLRGKTVPVEGLPANPTGLFQMHGNVWEWCADAWRDYSNQPQVDPVHTGTRVADRVVRGGSWFSKGRFCRSACRLRIVPGDRYDRCSIRLARGLLKEKKIQGSTGEAV